MYFCYILEKTAQNPGSAAVDGIPFGFHPHRLAHLDPEKGEGEGLRSRGPLAEGPQEELQVAVPRELQSQRLPGQLEHRILTRRRRP